MSRIWTQTYKFTFHPPVPSLILSRDNDYKPKWSCFVFLNLKLHLQPSLVIWFVRWSQQWLRKVLLCNQNDEDDNQRTGPWWYRFNSLLSAESKTKYLLMNTDKCKSFQLQKPRGLQHNSLFWKQHPKRRSSGAALRIQIAFLSYLFFNQNKPFFSPNSFYPVFGHIIHAWFYTACQREQKALLLM